MKRHLVFFGLFFAFFGYSQSTIDEIHQKSGVLLSKYTKKAHESMENKKFDSLTYDEAYKKLLDLYVKKEESESSQKADDLQRAFIDKMNITRYELSEMQERKLTLLEWVSENLEKTSFLSLEQAEEEYETFVLEWSKQYDENEEFFVFMLMTIQKFGGEIFGKVILEYEKNYPNSVTNTFLQKNGY